MGLFPVAPSVACRSGPGSWQSGFFFCAPVLPGSWPGLRVKPCPVHAADRRDARLRRIGSSAGLRPPPGCRTRSPQRHEQWFVRCRAPAAPPRWPMLPLVARAAAQRRQARGRLTAHSLRVAMLDRRRPRAEVMSCFPAAAVGVQVCMTGCGRVSFTAPPARPGKSQCDPGALGRQGVPVAPVHDSWGPCAGQGVGVRAPVARDTGWLTYRRQVLLRPRSGSAWPKAARTGETSVGACQRLSVRSRSASSLSASVMSEP